MKKCFLSLFFFTGMIVKASEVKDILAVAAVIFPLTEKITFNPDGKHVAALFKDSTIVVRKTDKLDTDFFTYTDPHLDGDQTISDIIFGGLNNRALYFRIFRKGHFRDAKGGTPALYSSFLIDDSNSARTFSCNPYGMTEQDSKSTTLLLDPQDMGSFSSLICPPDYNNSNYVICPSGPVTKKSEVVAITREGGSHVKGFLCMCKDRPNNRFFCMNMKSKDEHEALVVDTQTGKVLVSVPLEGLFKNPAAFVFDGDNTLIVLDEAGKALYINKPGHVQRVSDAIACDINDRDQLVVATKTALMLLQKNEAGKYKKELEIPHKVTDALVKFTPSGSKVVRLSLDEKRFGLRCTIFNLALQQIAKWNIESLGFPFYGTISFPKSNPNLMALEGALKSVIVRLPEDQEEKKESDAGQAQ